MQKKKVHAFKQNIFQKWLVLRRFALKVDGMMMVQSFPFKEMFLIKFSSFGLVPINAQILQKTLTL